MSGTPPPQYVAYPRGNDPSSYGTVEKLEALGEGYFGLSNIFYLNIVLLLAARILGVAAGLAVELIALIIVGLVTGALSYTQNKKIAFGTDAPESKAMMAAVLMGLTSWLCCGALGYSTLQGKASKEMERYGLRKGFFGVTRSKFRETLANRKNAGTLPVVPPGPLP